MTKNLKPGDRIILPLGPCAVCPCGGQCSLPKERCDSLYVYCLSQERGYLTVKEIIDSKIKVEESCYKVDSIKCILLEPGMCFIKCSQDSGDSLRWEMRAVIVRNKAEKGLILWREGEDLDSLTLEDAPIGISIWEGEKVEESLSEREPYFTDYCDKGRWFHTLKISYLKGEYRKPTEEEWSSIRQNKDPFTRWSYERDY